MRSGTKLSQFLRVYLSILIFPVGIPFTSRSYMILTNIRPGNYHYNIAGTQNLANPESTLIQRHHVESTLTE